MPGGFFKADPLLDEKPVGIVIVRPKTSFRHARSQMFFTIAFGTAVRLFSLHLF
jgi:hypothetical protein